MSEIRTTWKASEASSVLTFYMQTNPNTGKQHWQHMDSERMYEIFVQLRSQQLSSSQKRMIDTLIETEYPEA